MGKCCGPSLLSALLERSGGYHRYMRHMNPTYDVAPQSNCTLFCLYSFALMCVAFFCPSPCRTCGSAAWRRPCSRMSWQGSSTHGEPRTGTAGRTLTRSSRKWPQKTALTSGPAACIQRAASMHTFIHPRMQWRSQPLPASASGPSHYQRSYCPFHVCVQRTQKIADRLDETIDYTSFQRIYRVAPRSACVSKCVRTRMCSCACARAVSKVAVTTAASCNVCRSHISMIVFELMRMCVRRPYATKLASMSPYARQQILETGIWPEPPHRVRGGFFSPDVVEGAQPEQMSRRTPAERVEFRSAMALVTSMHVYMPLPRAHPSD